MISVADIGPLGVILASPQQARAIAEALTDAARELEAAVALVRT